LGFLAFSFSIKKYPVAQISVYAYINPFVAAFLGWYMLNETLSLYLVVSFLIAIMGVYLVNEGYRQKNRSNLKQHGTKITN
jgi:drug/metabolite transporter (DMT)-like permease